MCWEQLLGAGVWAQWPPSGGRGAGGTQTGGIPDRRGTSGRQLPEAGLCPGLPGRGEGAHEALGPALWEGRGWTLLSRPG